MEAKINFFKTVLIIIFALAFSTCRKPVASDLAYLVGEWGTVNGLLKINEYGDFELESYIENKFVKYQGSVGKFGEAIVLKVGNSDMGFKISDYFESDEYDLLSLLGQKTYIRFHDDYIPVNYLSEVYARDRIMQDITQLYYALSEKNLEKFYEKCSNYFRFQYSLDEFINSFSGLYNYLDMCKQIISHSAEFEFVTTKKILQGRMVFYSGTYQYKSDKITFNIIYLWDKKQWSIASLMLSIASKTED